MYHFFRIFLSGILVIATQWLFLGRVTLWGAYPDAVLLFVAWVGLRKGRQWGATTGFLTGILLDAIYGTWGLHMFVKTLLGFITGLYPATDRETLVIVPRQAFLGGFAVALIHNGIFVTLLALQQGVQNSFLVTGLWLGSALYTAFIAILADLLSDI
ncbi:MAG: rod shape-determining protein MreD [Bacteroidetes bacterium CG12_big_fil_rev_8_21_14_0_65_60_17]|nr:MAG: rod shape-determining protein MreD [Bacteroidetes bacterium CG12_big_fil_rev_8_21_14_0_65_60_17]